MAKAIRGWLTELGTFTSHPAAFAVFAVYSLLWVMFGHGYEWHSLATMATWGMTLVIQRAEHRDTQAIQAKLDELLKSVGNADSKVAGIDENDAEEVEEERRQRK
jgi:low affinity Fe/Cu permease